MRVRASPTLAFWFGVASGLLFAVAMGVFGQRMELAHTGDFSGYWAGGRALLLGVDPYDAERWVPTTRSFGTQTPDTAVYGYPPWVALAMAPLAALPLEFAASLWCIASIGMATLGIALLLRASPCPPAAELALGFALFGSQPAITALLVGQWSPMLTGALALGVIALRRERIAFAVPPLLMTLAKPQLFLMAVPVLALRHRRLILPLALAGGSIVLVATLVMPDWIVAWTRYVAPARMTDPPRAAVLASLAGELFGTVGTPLAQVATVACTLVVALRFGFRSTPAVATWLGVSIFVAPYSWSYDWMLYLVPMILGVSALRSRRPRRALALALFATVVLTLGASVAYAVAVSRGRETLSAIVPLAITLALVVALWPVARERDPSPRAG
jgi:hypothetical protein